MAEENQDEAPDWTVWLRSRLERLANTEGKQDGDESPPAAALAAPSPRPPAPVEDLAPPEPEVTAEPAVVDVELAGPPESGLARSGPSLPTESLPTESLPTESSPTESSPTESPPTDAALPTGPDPALVAGLDSVRSAVAALPTGPDPALVAGLESLRSATTALSARVEVLADANSNFRSVLNERFDEYAETVLRVVKGTTADLEEYRRMHAASISELRRTGAETADSLARLAGHLEELVTIQADDERWVEVMGQLCDEVTAERAWGRRREEARAEEVSSSTERLAAVEETLGLLATHVAELADRAQVQEQSPPALSFDGAEIRTLAAAVADALADRLPPMVPIPLAAPVPVAKRAPAKRVAKKRTAGPTAPGPKPSPAPPRRKTPIRVRGPVGPTS